MGKLLAFGVLVVGAIVAFTRMSPPTFNSGINEDVFTKVGPGLTMNQVDSVLGKPTRTSIGEPRKLVAVDGVKYVLYECASGRDVLTFYEGPANEQIVVASGNSIVVATEYVVDGCSVYYRGPKTDATVDSVTFYRPPSDRAKVVAQRISQSLSAVHGPALTSTPVAPESATAPPPPPPPPPQTVTPSGPVADGADTTGPSSDLVAPVKAAAGKLRDWLLEETVTTESHWRQVQQSRTAANYRKVAAITSAAKAYHEFAYAKCRGEYCDWEAYSEMRRQCQLPSMAGDPWFDYATAKQGSEGAFDNLIDSEKARFRQEIRALERDLDVHVKGCLARHLAVAAEVEQAVAKLTSRPVESNTEVATKSPPSKTRTWSSDNGHTIEAEFLSYGGGMVKLRTQDGQEISVELNRLSEQDQSWIRRRRYK